MEKASLIAIVLIPMLIITSTTSGEAQWGQPERITFNDYEEWTNPGSVAIDGNDLIHLTWTRENPDSGGQQVIYMEGTSGGWGEIIALTAGNLICSKPDIAVHTNGSSHVVWLRGSGDAGEVYYATNASGSWITERVTFNGTTDVHPVVAVDGDNIPHVCWAGFDTQSGEGKIFYGNRSSGSWEVEALTDSYIGDFWTGAAPSISVSQNGVVQIAYRGGNFGDYHIHQATNASGEWTIQELPSSNTEDFNSWVLTDYYGACYLAMSGNDGWGFPYHVYHTQSSDRGLTWSPRELATGTYSATTPVLGVDWYANSHITWEEVSGNMLTGTIFYSTNQSGSWSSQQITGEWENYSPSLAVDGSGGVHVFYVNSEGLVGDSTEVFHLTNSTPTVTLSLIPMGETVIPRGGSLSLDVTVTNVTDTTITGDLWFTGIVAASGVEFRVPPSYFNIPNPLHGSIQGGRIIHGTVRIDTPENVPWGLFTLVGSLGDYEEGIYLDRVAVSVRIVP
ncbi:MAG: hypothetical protein ACE5OP_08600 [Candidatus Glassbacteria bacterium]